MISISILAAQYRCFEWVETDYTMYKSERELKWNDLFISAWCVLLWDSYKFRIVTSSFQFFLALFQRGRLFRFIWQKKKWFFFSLVPNLQSTTHNHHHHHHSWSASLKHLKSLIDDYDRTSLWLTQIFHIFFFVSWFSFSVIHKS